MEQEGQNFQPWKEVQPLEEEEEIHRYFSCAWSVFGSVILDCNMDVNNVTFVQYSAKEY